MGNDNRSTTDRRDAERRADTVNHPPHYNHGRFEPIDVIEDWRLGFHLGNAVKYISRADHKGKRLEDLRKARWYLEREIHNEENRATERAELRAALTPPDPVEEALAAMDGPLYAARDIQRFLGATDEQMDAIGSELADANAKRAEAQIAFTANSTLTKR